MTDIEGRPLHGIATSSKPLGSLRSGRQSAMVTGPSWSKLNELHKDLPSKCNLSPVSDFGEAEGDDDAESLINGFSPVRFFLPKVDDNI